MPLPNLLLLGCQKCGTSWTHRALSKSRHIFGSKQKELNTLREPRDLIDLSEYESHFPVTENVTYYMESTPAYFQVERDGVDISANVESILESPALFVIFRNPVDRYESAYIHHTMQKRIPYTQNIDTLTDDFKMLQLGRYADILGHWRKRFPDIEPLFYDDLLTDRVSFTKRIFESLDIDFDLTPDDLDFTSNSKNRKNADLGFNWPAFPKMTPELRSSLKEYYTDQIRALQDMADRDLSEWLA